VSISLEVPETPNNINLGMFMVTLHLYSDQNQTIAYANRPCMVRYRSWLLRRMHTIIFSGFSLVGWYEEKQLLDVPLLQYFQIAKNYGRVRAEVSLSNSGIQIYSSHLEIRAILSWFRYFLLNWPITSFLVCFPFIFVVDAIVVLTISAVIGLRMNARLATSDAANPRAPSASSPPPPPNANLGTPGHKRNGEEEPFDYQKYFEESIGSESDDEQSLESPARTTPSTSSPPRQDIETASEGDSPPSKESSSEGEGWVDVGEGPSLRPRKRDPSSSNVNIADE